MYAESDDWRHGLLTYTGHGLLLVRSSYPRTG